MNAAGRMCSVLLLFVAVSFSTSAFESTGDSNPLIARIWLERAYSLLHEGGRDGNTDWAAAADAWRVASDFRAPGRDALYLRARMIVSDSDPLLKPGDIYSSGKYRRALDVLSRSWEMQKPDIRPDIVPFEERAKFWASLALRNREYRELIRRFESWPRAYQVQSELIYAASRAALYLGLYEKAAGLANKGESLGEVSENLEFLDMNYGPALPAFRAIAVAAGDNQAIQTLVSARRQWGSEIQDKALLPWVLSGHIPAGVLKSLPVQYSSFLDSALKLIHSHPVPLIDTPEQLAKNVTARNNIAVFRLPGVSATFDISEISGEFTGEFISDADYDGFPEETIRMVAGKPVSRQIDGNQDGKNEWVIDYRNGNPLRILLSVDDASMSVNYEDNAYPSVFSISRTGPSAIYDIRFKPGEFYWSPLDLSDPFMVPDRPDWQESEIWQAARKVFVKYQDSEGWSAQTVSTLANGYPLRAEETRFSGPQGNEKEWTRQLLYQDGLPVAGRMSYRNDSRNPLLPLWEVYERYENGRLVGIAWTPQSSGQAVFLHDWALRGILETQAWNLDNDPWIDVRRLLFPGDIENSKSLMIGEVQASDLIPWSAADWAPWEY